MKYDWKKTLATVAPALATALGGPMAGVAVNMAAQALGLGRDATEDDIAAVVASGNPDVLVKLKEVELDFRAKMKSMDVEVDRIHSADRSSARQLGVAKGTGPQIVLSAVFVVGYFYIFSLFYHMMTGGVEVSEKSLVLMSTLLGVLTAGMTQVMNYWFGSTAGSRAKTDLIAGAPR